MSPKKSPWHVRDLNKRKGPRKRWSAVSAAIIPAAFVKIKPHWFALSTYHSGYASGLAGALEMLHRRFKRNDY